MPDILAVLRRRWKPVAGFTLVVTAVAAVIAVTLPARYRSVATALPASSFATDKSTIFNSNIQELYSALGTADDLDRVIGTAQLDTLYIALVQELNLISHYGLEGNNAALDNAVGRLKKATSVMKSEWGELKISAWDNDKIYAARIANGLLQKLQRLHQALRNQSNQLVLQKLQEAAAIKYADSLAVKNETSAYTQLLSQYSLMVATNPPVLLVVEEARPALHPDNTLKWATVLVTFFAALLLSLLLALYADAKKRRS